MSHLTPGLIGAYNSLTDKHLTTYFNNARIRRHLQRVGLISRSGRIVSEKEFRYKIIHRDQQRHVRECLAQAIFHRVLDMERLHQTEIRRKLEDFSRKERVNKIKVECGNRYEDDPLIVLTPRPPTRLRGSQTRHSGLEREASDSTDSFGSLRPNTAPEKTQRPVRLKPLNCTSTPTSTKRNSSQSHKLTNDREQPISCMLDRDVMRHLTLRDFSCSASPYRLPVINNLVTPVPPKKDKLQNRALRGRRYRATTAPSDVPDKKESAVQRVSSQTAVVVTMMYFGKSLRLTHELNELKDEVKVFQQHCGGENLCVYKGRLREGESFQFISRRHRGFPFSLTFYLNGLQVERLSSCCEFKHRKNSRPGGRSSHFGFSGVEGAAPCYRCIIAMGLDKKPSPPKRIRNEPITSKSSGNEEEEKHMQSETSQSQDTETKRNTNQEHKHKNGYEEDFEADDEGPMDDGVDEGNERSPLLSRVEEDGRRRDENGTEDVKRDKVRGSSSVSSGLSSRSSSSEEDEDETDEAQKEEEVKFQRHTVTSTPEKHAQETEVLQTSSTSLPTEEVPPKQEEHTKKEDENLQEEHKKTGETRDKAGETVEPIEKLQEAEEPLEKLQHAEEPRSDLRETEKYREEFREKRAGNVSYHEEQAKFVQEKLADAILSMTECVSEPELSDSTTEEDEMMWVRSMKNGPETQPDSIVAPQPANEESGAEPVEDTGGEDAHVVELTEEHGMETNQTQQPETKTETQEKDTKQIEVKKDENVAEEKNSDDEQNNKYTKPEVTQNIDEEDGQTNEVNNLTYKNNELHEEPELMEKPEYEDSPDDELPKSEESFEQKPKEEATSEIVNDEETRTSQVEDQFNMIEEMIEIQPEIPEETSMNYDNMDQKSDIEKVTDEGWSGGEEVSKDNVTEEQQAEKEETSDEETRNLQNNGEETGNDITLCDREENVNDTELELKVLSVSEVNNEDLVGEEEKLEEIVEVSKVDGEMEQRYDGDGVKIRNRMEGKGETKEKEAKDQEITEERTEQKSPDISGQSSENNVGEQEEEEQKAEIEQKVEEKAGSEGEEKVDDNHEESSRLKEVNDTEFLKEGNTDVAGADAGMTELEHFNYKEQEETPTPNVPEVLEEAIDGPEEKSEDIDAENRDIITVDKEKLNNQEVSGPVEGKETEEGVKEEEMDLCKENQRKIQLERITAEEFEVEEEQRDKKHAQQETTREEVKDEQKAMVENITPLISEDIINVTTEYEASSDLKTSAGDVANAELEPNINDLERGEENVRAIDGNYSQSSTFIEKDKSAETAEESRSLEGSISPSEESQPLEKLLALRREEREAELIVAPQTDQEELVSNWVNVHQASNYFETFVGPLDEMVANEEKSVNAEVPGINQESSEIEMDEQNNMETKALRAEGYSSSSNPSGDEEQINTEQNTEDQENINNIMNISATPVMKIEISQTS